MDSSSSSCSLLLDSPPKPNKIVTYPLGSDDNGGAVYLFGNVTSPNIALLCAGYPDDQEYFLSFANELSKSKDANCFVGVTCLPGYDDRLDHKYLTKSKVDGYTFTEWALAIGESIKVLRKESTYTGKDGKGKRAKLTGIYHDWGVVAGLIHTNRNLAAASASAASSSSSSVEDSKDDVNVVDDPTIPDQLVLFDVLLGPHPKTPNKPTKEEDVPKDTFLDMFRALAYRFVFAISFMIRRYLSKWVGQIIFIFGYQLLNIFHLTPTYDDIDTTKKWPPRIDYYDPTTTTTTSSKMTLDRMVYMCYPYYNFFKIIFTGTIKKELWGCTLPKDLNKTPILYMYGTKKRVHFHDQRGLKLLLQQEQQEQAGKDSTRRRSKVVPVDDAGHWLYLQQPELCLKEVIQFIQDA